MFSWCWQDHGVVKEMQTHVNIFLTSSFNILLFHSKSWILFVDFFLPETSRACSICTLNEILTESWVCEVHNLKKKLGGMSK